MARPKKIGLDYFPFDVDLFSDIKIRKLIKHQGSRSLPVYIYLLCYIYDNGYYIEWDSDLPFIIWEKTGCEEGYVNEVIKSCLSIGLFNQELFKNHSILTSKGIQERYLSIIGLLRRKIDIKEYSLVNVSKTRVNAEETPKSAGKSTQRKKKESKVKESSSRIGPPTPTSIVGRLKSHEDLKDQMKSHSEWKNTFAKNLGLSSVDVADKWIDRFVDHAIANGRGDDILFLREAKSYCLNWVRTRVKAGETPNSQVKREEKYVIGKGRVIRHG